MKPRNYDVITKFRNYVTTLCAALQACPENDEAAGDQGVAAAGRNVVAAGRNVIAADGSVVAAG